MSIEGAIDILARRLNAKAINPMGRPVTLLDDTYVYSIDNSVEEVLASGLLIRTNIVVETYKTIPIQHRPDYFAPETEWRRVYEALNRGLTLDDNINYVELGSLQTESIDETDNGRYVFITTFSVIGVE